MTKLASTPQQQKQVVLPPDISRGDGPETLVRKCRACSVEKPATLTYFYAKEGHWSGLMPRCKKCHKAEMRERHRLKRIGLPKQAPIWDRRLATEVEKAWMAGFVDGEGTIGGHIIPNKNRDAYSLRISIQNCVANSLTLFVELYAGRVLLKTKAINRRRAAYVWYCPANAYQKFLLDLSPYLRIKSQQCEFALRFVALGDGRSKRTASGCGPGWRFRIMQSNVYEAKQEIYQALAELNKRGQ